MSVYQTTTRMNLSHRRRRPRLRIDVAASRGSGVQEFVGVSAAGWSSARFGQGRVRSSTVVSVAPSSARPVPGKSRMRSGTRRAARPSPASGESACPLAAASPTPCLSPAPGGVDLVMSPGLALCQVGSRGSSADGFRRGPDPDPRPIPSRSGRPASTYPWQTFSRVTRRSRGPDGVPLADLDSPNGEDDDEAMARTDSGPARTEWLTSPTARTARRRLRGRGAALLAGHGQSRRRSPSRCAQPYWRTAPLFTGA